MHSAATMANQPNDGNFCYNGLIAPGPHHPSGHHRGEEGLPVHHQIKAVDLEKGQLRSQMGMHSQT